MKRNVSVFKKIILIYVGIISVFALFYLLPVAQKTPINWLDAFFLSTSAISVTGLSSINIGTTLSDIGVYGLMLQMQLGGIGIIIIVSYFLMLLGKKLSYGELKLIESEQNQKKIKNATIWVTLWIAILVETIGFVLVYPIVKEQSEMPIKEALFHVISSFTNSGFVLDGSTFVRLSEQSIFLWVTSILIFLGGLGFVTMLEYTLKIHRKKSLFATVNLRMHVYLMVVGVFLISLLEKSFMLSMNSWWDSIQKAMFTSVTARSGGMAIMDVAAMQDTTWLVLVGLMFIGGASVSAAGGIRLTTFAVLMAKMVSIFKGQTEVVMLRKTIKREVVEKAFVIVTMFLILLAFATFSLVLIEDMSMKVLFFEGLSALTNSGLSFGITHELHALSKIILMGLMIVGRLGIFGFIYVFRKKQEPTIRYIGEDVIVG